METYILRAPKAVEPQNRKPNARPPLRPDPALAATVEVICGPTTPIPPLAVGPRVLYVGLNVHND